MAVLLSGGGWLVASLSLALTLAFTLALHRFQNISWIGRIATCTSATGPLLR